MRLFRVNFFQVEGKAVFSRSFSSVFSLLFVVY